MHQSTFLKDSKTLADVIIVVIIFVGLVVLKQTGITMLELLIGLSIMSGVSLYTMKMTEEVEGAVAVYQDSVQDLKVLKEKLKSVKQVSQAEEYEAIIETMQTDLAELDEAFYLDE